MPIVSVNPIDKKIYRVTVTLGHNMMENIVVSDDGLYSVFYIQNGTSHNHTGRILNVIQNNMMPQNSYILFDWSADNHNRRERIYFHQIQYIKDVTPNDAYRIAIQHGFVGSVEDWLEFMRGYPGKSNYEIAVECGYEGTQAEYIESCRGARGYSAYEIAVRNGFQGTEEEWLASLTGKDGKSAYEIAVEHGYEGTEEEWINDITAGVQTSVSNLADAVAANKTAAEQDVADEAAAREAADSELNTKIAGNTAAINKLNGGAENEGSVLHTVNTVLAQLLVGDGSQETIDSLTELVEWANSHSTEVVEMSNDIEQNKVDISALETLLGTLPEGVTATTVVAYIAEAAQTAAGTAAQEYTDENAVAKSSVVATAAEAATSVDEASAEKVASEKLILELFTWKTEM